MSMAGATAGAIDQVGAYVRPEHGMLWIGLRNPSPELLGKVVSELGACDKNQEEMLEPHRRQDHRLRQHGADRGHHRRGRGRAAHLRRDPFLIGDGFLVTVRRGATAGHSPLRERLEASPDLLKRGSDVASELLDWLVDRYVAAAAKIERGRGRRAEAADPGRQRIPISAGCTASAATCCASIPWCRRWPRFAAAWRGSR